MLRFLAVIVFFVLALGSGVWGVYSAKQNGSVEPEVVEYEMTSVEELLSDRPVEGAFEINGFDCGRVFVGVDKDGEKGWEEAYLPLFSIEDYRSHNRVCIIYQTDEFVEGEATLEFFDRAQLKGYVVPAYQKLSSVAFNKLAKVYSSLNYSKCMVFSTSKPVKEKLSEIWIGGGLFALFLGLAGWQSLGMLSDMKRRIGNEKEYQSVTDSAGLGSLLDGKE